MLKAKALIEQEEVYSRAELLAILRSEGVWIGHSASYGDVYVGRTEADVRDKSPRHGFKFRKFALDGPVQDMIWVAHIYNTVAGNSLVYVGHSHDQVYQQLVDYCYVQWEDVAEDEDDDPPTNEHRLVTKYFKRSSDEAFTFHPYATQ